MNQLVHIQPFQTRSLGFQIASKVMEDDLPETIPSESSTVEGEELGEESEEFSFTRLGKLLASDEWDKVVKQEGLRIYVRRGDASKIKMVRLYGEFDCTPEHLFNCMFDAKTRGQWDKTIAEHYVLNHINETTNVLYTRARLPVISSRDIVEVRMTHAQPEREFYEVISRSVEDEACPHVRGVVRGNCIFTGNRIYRKDSNTSVMEMILHYDPCGKIPKGVVNCSMKMSLKKFYTDLKKGCAKTK